MQVNTTGHNASAVSNPLHRRVAHLSSQAEHHGAASAEEVALRSEARQRLKAGHQDNRRASIKAADDEARERSSRSWTFWAVFDLLLLLLIVPIVVSAPPVFDCRRQQHEVGFFAGNSFEKCAIKGISERWEALDSRLKMLVRGSGH